MEIKKRKLVVPALRGAMGNWIYYSSVMNAKQISKWISSVKDIREAKSLNEVLQRDLHKRKNNIAKYLLSNDSRFFNSIIIGVWGGVPDWIVFDISKKIEQLSSTQDAELLDETMGLLIFDGNEQMFAIDGQHRVAGISIAYNQDNEKAEKDKILKDDQFPVVFIAHIDDIDGRKRTRKLFSDINKNAKPVATGDKIIIDEEDLCAIVTRKLYAEYSYFQGGELIALTGKGNLDLGDTKHFTNLPNLYSISKIIRKLYKIQKGTKTWEEVNIDNFYKIMTNFFDFMIRNVNEYSRFFIDLSLSLEEARENNQYLLFRPIGIILLAKLYVYFYKNNDLESLVRHLNMISFKFPESPFNNILWKKGKMEAGSKNQKLAYNLSLYLLGELNQIKTDILLEDYRTILSNDEISLPNKIKN